MGEETVDEGGYSWTDDDGDELVIEAREDCPGEVTITVNDSSVFVPAEIARKVAIYLANLPKKAAAPEPDEAQSKEDVYLAVLKVVKTLCKGDRIAWYCTHANEVVAGTVALGISECNSVDHIGVMRDDGRGGLAGPNGEWLLGPSNARSIVVLHDEAPAPHAPQSATGIVPDIEVVDMTPIDL